jgi:hypothetical protein
MGDAGLVKNRRKEATGGERKIWLFRTQLTSDVAGCKLQVGPVLTHFRSAEL